MYISNVVLSFLFLFLITNTAFADIEVVATVNGKPITSFELSEEFQNILPLMGSYHGGVPSEKMLEIREKAMSSLIDKELQYQYALENEVPVSSKDIDSEVANIEKRFGSSAKFKDAMKKGGITKKELREFVKKRLLSSKAKKQVVTDKAAIGDIELKDYYEKNKSAFKRPVELRASHILIGVEPSASREERENKLKLTKEILAKLKAGEDFSKLAMRYSTDQGSAPIGGDLGTFHKGMADEAFEKAVLSLNVGQVSDIVETLYGYHIILLTGLKPEAQLTFDEVKDDVRTKLEKKRADELYKKWIDGLKAKAKIEIVKK